MVRNLSKTNFYDIDATTLQFPPRLWAR